MIKYSKLPYRSFATMGLGCNYVLLDAQTIQMVKVDEALGNKGSLGRQFIMQAVAQVPLKHIFKDLSLAYAML